MSTDVLNYSGVIPDQFIVRLYDFVKLWYNANLDNQLARTVCAIDTVDPTTEQFEITKIDFSGKDVVPGAKKSPGSQVSMGAGSEKATIYRWSDNFDINGDDLRKDPQLQSRYVEACIAHIFRGEDKVFVNGRSVNNITGLVTAARANKNGKIAASAGTYNNNGAWLTVDADGRDIYEDVRAMRGLLDSKYRANKRNLYLVGNAASLDALDQKDPYNDNSTPISASVAPLLGRTITEPITSWAIVNEQVAAGYVYLVSKNKDAAQLVQAQGIVIDTDYPRKAINNYEIHLFQDVGMAFYDVNGFVECAIT